MSLKEAELQSRMTDLAERQRPTTEEQLMALRMLARDGEPTVLGMLALDSDVRGFLPGAYLQFLRVAVDLPPLLDPVQHTGLAWGRSGRRFDLCSRCFQSTQRSR